MVAVAALGTVIAVRPPSDATDFASVWRRCAVPGPMAVADTDRLIVDLPDNANARAVEIAVTTRALHAAAGRMHLWHAAGIATETGAVLALVAASGAGKTTAAAALCRDGFGYVTDEALGVSADGRVLPYPKPLAVRLDSSSSAAKRLVGPDELGLAECPAELRLGGIVVLRREPGQRVPTLERLPLVEAILNLTCQSSGLALMTEPLTSLCRLLDQLGGVHRLRYGEIADAASVLRTLAWAARVPGESWEPIAAAASIADITVGAQELLARGPYVEAVSVDGDILVLQDGAVAHVSGIAASVWSHLHDPDTLPGVLAAMRRRHGRHTDDERIVGEAIAGLEVKGLLGRHIRK